MTADGAARARRPDPGSCASEGITIVVVEHDMDVIAKVCDAVTVLNFGRTLIDGPPGRVLASDEVRTAYLGT